MTHLATQPATSKTSPGIIAQAVLAALQFITGGTALIDVGVSKSVVGLIIVILGGCQLAAAIITRGMVTPAGDVAAKRTGAGAFVAGPASPIVDGLPVAVVNPALLE